MVQCMRTHCIVHCMQVLSDHFFSYGVVTTTVCFGGGFAVNMFFVMSGFVMTIGYGAKAAQAAATTHDSLRFTRTFLARRVAQIGPVMWLSAIAYIPIALYVDGLRHDLPLLGANLVLTATFTAAWLPFPHGDGVNGPLWTLSVQFMFWALLCPLAARFGAPPRSWRVLCWRVARDGLCYVMANGIVFWAVAVSGRPARLEKVVRSVCLGCSLWLWAAIYVLVGPCTVSLLHRLRSL